MNMMTTVALPSDQPCRRPLIVPDLLMLADRAMTLAGIRPTEFGSRLARDPGLIRDMRDKGRTPRRKLRLAIEDYADDLIRQARERAFATLIDSFERDDVEAAVDGLIALLDQRDGDPDLEDATGDEDSFEDHTGYGTDGPGCRIADVDEGDEEDGEPGDDREPDVDAEPLTWPERGDGYQPGRMSGGLAHHHDEDEPEDATLRRPHRNRIRATRCDRVGLPPYPRYRLRSGAGPVSGFGATLS